MNKNERCTPVYYSPGEEIFCAISHGLGALFGIFALGLMLFYTIKSGNITAMVAGGIYGISLIFLYTMSTLSHAITNPMAKKVFRILDHATIYLLIAGTYTPISLITLRGPLGWTIFGLQWVIAAAGIVFNSVALNRSKRFSLWAYIIMGWCIIFAVYPLLTHMAPAGFLYLAVGGLFYTAGILFYQMKGVYAHGILHIFVLVGSVLQFISVYQYVLPLAL